MAALTQTLTIRVTQEDIDTIKALASSTPYAKDSDIARDALRRGLQVLQGEKKGEGG